MTAGSDGQLDQPRRRRRPSRSAATAAARRPRAGRPRAAAVRTARRSPRRCYKRDVLALLYDVHGNLPALEAVIADAEAAGRGAAGCSAATTRCSAAGRPRRSSGCARSSRASWIRGNGERWTADPAAAPENPVVPGAIAAARGRARRRDRSTTSPRCRSRCPLRGHAGLPRVAAERRPLVRTRARRRGRASCSTAPTRRGSSSATPTCRSPAARAAASSSSTPARSGCRSTAIRARPTPLLADDGRIEHRRVGVRPRRRRRARPGLGEEWPSVVARRIERATMDV